MTATIGVFSATESPVVRTALQNTPGNIARMIQVLQRILLTVGQGPSPVIRPFSRLQGINRDRDRLYAIFQVNASNRQAGAHINAIIGRYRATASILDDPSTQIERLTPAILARINARRNRARLAPLNAATVWGYASAVDLIHIGDAFFNSQSDDRTRRHVARCQGSENLDLARSAVLVHEAVHCHNVMGGHGSLSHIVNPDNYNLFMMYTVCDNLIAQIQVSTDQRMARVEERTPGITVRDRFRRPGPLA